MEPNSSGRKRVRAEEGGPRRAGGAAKRAGGRRRRRDCRACLSRANKAASHVTPLLISGSDSRERSLATKREGKRFLSRDPAQRTGTTARTPAQSGRLPARGTAAGEGSTQQHASAEPLAALGFPTVGLFSPAPRQKYAERGGRDPGGETRSPHLSRRRHRPRPAAPR